MKLYPKKEIRSLQKECFDFRIFCKVAMKTGSCGMVSTTVDSRHKRLSRTRSTQSGHNSKAIKESCHIRHIFGTLIALNRLQNYTHIWTSYTSIRQIEHMSCSDGILENKADIVWNDKICIQIAPPILSNSQELPVHNLGK